MSKTDRMLLIEERSGKDVREVLAEAFDAKGSLSGALDWIAERYGIRVSLTVGYSWLNQLDGTVRATIEFAGWARPESERLALA